MKVKNASNSIVSVGAQSILPGEECFLPDTYAELPGIKALVRHGELTIVQRSVFDNPEPEATAPAPDPNPAAEISKEEIQEIPEAKKTESAPESVEIEKKTRRRKATPAE